MPKGMFVLFSAVSFVSLLDIFIECDRMGIAKWRRDSI